MAEASLGARAQWRALDSAQRNVVAASFLGWMLDAFDYFLLVFVVHDIAQEFGASVVDVTLAMLLTLAMRPLGALIFGILADRYGRRPILMIDIVLYSAVELASAFAPSLAVLLVLRALYGVAMGGEWGVGASLTMESIPAKSRGLVSGLLQEGYAAGYLLAALAFFALYPLIGWRGMFMVGAAPALLVLFIRARVPESPVWQAGVRAGVHKAGRIWHAIAGNWRRFLYAIVLMTAFNFFSHGTQDLYPTFLREQRGLSSDTVGLIAVVYNVGALIGGIFFGTLSQRLGRRRTIVLAALLAIPMVPLWAFSATPVLIAVGAFLIQFMVQGAWGVVPAHLNELSPPTVRGTFPGFTYQLGNLLAAGNATFQAQIAAHHGGNYAIALAGTAIIVALVLAVFAGFGPEAREISFDETAGEEAAPSG